MKYYAISTHINKAMSSFDDHTDLSLLFYTFFDTRDLPATFVLAEKLADFAYYTFAEFTIASKNTVIAFIALPTTANVKSYATNYVELPSKPLKASIDYNINAILLTF